MDRLIGQVRLTDSYRKIVHGYADSLPIFRQLLPERRKNKEKFSLTSLTESYFPNFDKTSLHNAVKDNRVLKKLLDILGVSDNVIRSNAKRHNTLVEEKKQKNIYNINEYLYSSFKNNLSSTVINKMARSGVTSQVLQNVFDKSGIDGLHTLLSESIDGKARVRTNAKIIKKILSLFQQANDS